MAAFGNNMTFNSTSSSNNTEFLFKMARGPEPIVWIIVIYCVSIVGCFFFILLFKVFLMQRESWNGSKVLLVHLVLLEFSLCLIQFPLQHTATFLALNGIPATGIRCPETMLALITTTHTGNWTAFFLAIIRYFAAVAPGTYKAFNVRWKRFCIILLSWIISLAVTLPFYFGKGGRWLAVSPFRDCGTHPEGVYFRIHQTLGSYFPMLATVAVYLAIFLRNKVLTHKWQPRVHPAIITNYDSAGNLSRTSNHSRTIQRRLAVTRMLFVASVWNCVCYFPTPIFVNLFPSHAWSGISVRLWVKVIQLSGYAMNPIIFLFLNTEYQAGLHTILGQARRTPSKT